MLIWTIIKVALRSLYANKLRSFLAMLGIIIGVAAVISMLALGAGARKQVMDRMTAMGANLLIVRPGSATRGGVRSSASWRSLRVEDAEAILAQAPDVEAVAPLVMGRTQVKYFNRNTNTTIAGSTLTYLSLRNFEVEKGRVFSAEEETRPVRLAVLGAKAAEDLFGAANPVNCEIKIKGINFRVLGVLKAKGDQGWFNPDDMIVIPYLTAMRQVFGQIHLSEIDLRVREGADLTGVEAAVTQILAKRHRIRPEAEPDFHVRNQAELIETASSIIQTFTILLGGIAGISLVVGGIGIMNIMLVTVTERTREIGVRKAIGARDRDILRQFLLESVLISGLGGALGIAVGFGVAAAVQRYSEYTTIVEPYSVILSLAVSASVGIFFGYYPAYRAAGLDPIEALRYE